LLRLRRDTEISRSELAKRTKPIQTEMRERFEVLATHPEITKKAAQAMKASLTGVPIPAFQA